MARGFLARGVARVATLAVYLERACWPDVVREAQEAVELMLKASLRCVGIEPARTHDVAETLRANADRFPEWFAARIPELAAISTELVGARGPAFYGDERLGIPPDQLYDESSALRAAEQARFVEAQSRRLIEGG